MHTAFRHFGGTVMSRYEGKKKKKKSKGTDENMTVKETYFVILHQSATFITSQNHIDL